jgi:hypothetical protein
MYSPFFYDIAEHLHHGNGLFLGEALVFESLDELERIEVMVSWSLRRRRESSPTITQSDRSTILLPEHRR